MKNNLEKIFDFSKQAGKLKFSYRFSQAKFKPKESVAAHSWRLSLLAMLLVDELNLDINKEKVLKIAIAHDLVESFYGDIDYVLVAQGKATREGKYKQEEKVIGKLSKMLSSVQGKAISDLWHEYADRKTNEARFVFALDKIEALMTLLEVGFQGYNHPEFIPNYADEAVGDFPELKPLLKLLKEKLKDEFIKGGIEWKDEYKN